MNNNNVNDGNNSQFNYSFTDGKNYSVVPGVDDKQVDSGYRNPRFSNFMDNSTTDSEVGTVNGDLVSIDENNNNKNKDNRSDSDNDKNDRNQDDLVMDKNIIDRHNNKSIFLFF